MVTHAVAAAHNCTSAVWTEGGKTPFQLYITLKLHANNQQKSAIATFLVLGMSVIWSCDGRAEWLLFHDTAMTLTSHLTHDQIREDPPPLFLRANISSSILVMPLCPTLMNMLVISPCYPYLIPRVNPSWYRVTWRIVAPRCRSGLRMKCNIQQPDDVKQWSMVGNSQSSMKKHHRCRNRPCPWPWKHWSL